MIISKDDLNEFLLRVANGETNCVVCGADGAIYCGDKRRMECINCHSFHIAEDGVQPYATDSEDEVFKQMVDKALEEKK